MITIEQLIKITDEIESRDFRGYAQRIAEIDPVLGAFELMHAEANIGEDGTVKDLIVSTFNDARYLAERNVQTAEQARALWSRDFLR